MTGPRVAVAGTDEREIAAAVAALGDAWIPSDVAPHRTLTEAMTAVLETAFAALPPGGPVPLYVLCGEYSRFAADRYVAACHDTSRRLRPSDSIGLESSELVRPFLTGSDRAGDCFLLADARAALPCAGVICEAVVTTRDPRAPGGLVFAGIQGAGGPEIPRSPAEAFRRAVHVA